MGREKGQNGGGEIVLEYPLMMCAKDHGATKGGLIKYIPMDFHEVLLVKY